MGGIVDHLTKENASEEPYFKFCSLKRFFIPPLVWEDGDEGLLFGNFKEIVYLCKKNYR
jgi:hypothetical protein